MRRRQLLVACLLVQVLPLPAEVVAILSPNSARLRSALAFATTGTPPWTPLSIDREATLRSMANVALGILTFWIARGLFAAGGSTRSFCRGLAVFADSAWIIGGMHVGPSVSAAVVPVPLGTCSS